MSGLVETGCDVGVGGFGEAFLSRFGFVFPVLVSAFETAGLLLWTGWAFGGVAIEIAFVGVFHVVWKFFWKTGCAFLRCGSVVS